jgi:hypothetical protein
MTRFALPLLLAATLLTTACGGGTSTGGATPTTARLSSPATVSIVSPAPGAVITGTTVHVVLAITGATITQQVTTNVRPDQGHVHLYLDGSIESLNSSLAEDIPVHPGNYELHAEFVASDHLPFEPRVISAQVLFSVT